MNNATLPTLTRDAYLTNPVEILKKQFAYFLAADYSQSDTFNGDIASLKYVLAIATDTDDVKSKLSEVLYKLYYSYFKNVNINITLRTSSDNSIMNYNIEITVVDDTNTEHILSRVVSTSMSNISNYNFTLAKYIESCQI